jgi:DeoR/GlpR family transcriptional regulator of sugar metabolism
MNKEKRRVRPAPYLTVAEAARRSHSSVSAIHRAIDSGELAVEALSATPPASIPKGAEDRPLESKPTEPQRPAPRGAAIYLIRHADFIDYHDKLRERDGSPPERARAKEHRVLNLAERLHLLGAYPRDTTFGERVWESEWTKRYLASYTTMTRVSDGQRIFIADGSTGLWLMAAVLYAGLDVEVLTNNAAVGMEAILSPRGRAITTGAPGVYDRQYAGLFGRDTETFLRERLAECHTAILPVTGLTLAAGPAAGTKAAGVKQAVLESCKRTILILSHDKLGLAPAAVFNWGWENILRSDRSVHIICSAPPESAAEELKQRFAAEAKLFENACASYRGLSFEKVSIPRSDHYAF